MTLSFFSNILIPSFPALHAALGTTCLALARSCVIPTIGLHLTILPSPHIIACFSILLCAVLSAIRARSILHGIGLVVFGYKAKLTTVGFDLLCGVGTWANLFAR